MDLFSPRALNGRVATEPFSGAAEFFIDGQRRILNKPPTRQTTEPLGDRPRLVSHHGEHKQPRLRLAVVAFGELVSEAARLFVERVGDLFQRLGRDERAQELESGWPRLGHSVAVAPLERELPWRTTPYSAGFDRR